MVHQGIKRGKTTSSILWAVLCLIGVTRSKAGDQLFDESDCPPDGSWLFGLHNTDSPLHSFTISCVPWPELVHLPVSLSLSHSLPLIILSLFQLSVLLDT